MTRNPPLKSKLLSCNDVTKVRKLRSSRVDLLDEKVQRFMRSTLSHTSSFPCSSYWSNKSGNYSHKKDICHKHIKNGGLYSGDRVYTTLPLSKYPDYPKQTCEQIETTYQQSLRYWEFLFNKKISPYRNCFENLKFYKADKDHPDRFTHFSIDWNQELKVLLFNLMVASRMPIDSITDLPLFNRLLDEFNYSFIDAFFIVGYLSMYENDSKEFYFVTDRGHQPLPSQRVDYKKLLTGGDTTNYTSMLFGMNENLWGLKPFRKDCNPTYKALSANRKSTVPYDNGNLNQEQVIKVLQEKKWRDL